MPSFPSSLTTTPHDDVQAVRLLAVVVLYRQTPAQSQSLVTLLQAMEAARKVPLHVQILVADNTPGGQDPGLLPEHVRYVAYPNNPGLSKPYNDALSWAGDHYFEWLLTLDQDTTLPLNFLEQLFHYLRHWAPEPAVASIVPRLEDKGRPISPLSFKWGFWPRIMPAGSEGLAERHASAVNSASVHRVSALVAIGGYDPRFPLHNSDTSLFKRLDSAGKRIVVAGQIVVAHEMSMVHRDGRISPERYQHTLKDECRFWDGEMGSLGRAERTLRLLGRLLRGRLTGESAAMQKVTWEELVRRLRTSRKQRLAEENVKLP